MWWIGALFGTALALVVETDAWLFGAVIGGLIGWFAGRQGRERAADRLAELEGQLEMLQQRLDRVDGRIASLESTSSVRASGAEAPAPAADPAVPRFQTGQSVLSAREASLDAAGPAAAAHVKPLQQLEPKAPSRGLADMAQWRWLTAGNALVRVGMVILFFGVAFLLKFAYEHVRLPIELRLTGVALVAIALLVLGWQLRTKRPGYGLALQGGGVGILYLVIFAAFRLYELVAPGPAFALLVGTAAFSAFLSVAQESRALAVLSASGGFLAPVLASAGGGSHVMLFSYYGVLNAGILAIAWFKAWRVLNLVGFGFSFAIGTIWGSGFYRPNHLASTGPFLLFFFLLYVAIPLLFARHAAGRLERYMDATLVFGVPLVAFGLQVGLVREIEYGAALSALALGVFYLVLAKAVFKRTGGQLRLLVEAFLALGVAFATLAIPLALDGRLTSAVWALEGAAIVWVGVRQRRFAARAFGMALQFLAGVAFRADASLSSGGVPIANSFFLGCLCVALGGLYCAWHIERNHSTVRASERIVANVLFTWGLAWWIAGALYEIDAHVLRAYRGQAALLFLSASTVSFSILYRHLEWHAARYVALAHLLVMVLLAAWAIAYDAHPFVHVGWFAWPLAFVAHFGILRRHDSAVSSYQYWMHAAGLWLLAALGSWEVGWAINRLGQGSSIWSAIAWALVPGGLLAAIALRGARIAWPVAAHRDAYFVAGAAPLAFFLALWMLVVNFVSSGDPAPLSYAPVLNPLDIAEVGAVLAIALWFVEGRRLGIPAFTARSPASGFALVGVATFVWVNGILLRTLHHWAEVPFDFERMLRSDLVQTAFSIAWTAIALVSMIFATQVRLRVLWIAGAGLLAVVVAKLFLIDLSNVATIERIVSFISVGVLMLVVGYFSPVPPKRRRQAQSDA